MAGRQDAQRMVWCAWCLEPIEEQPKNGEGRVVYLTADLKTQLAA